MFGHRKFCGRVSSIKWPNWPHGQMDMWLDKFESFTLSQLSSKFGAYRAFGSWNKTFLTFYMTLCDQIIKFPTTLWVAAPHPKLPLRKFDAFRYYGGED